MGNREVIFRRSELNDVFELAPILRQSDLNELEAQQTTPLQALLRGYIYSDECYTVLLNGWEVGMFGVNSKDLPKGFGAIWFLGTQITALYPFVFVRQGRKYINQWLNKYKILLNMVDARNTLHIKWLKAMGVLFGRDIYVNGYRFIQFYKTRKTRCVQAADIKPQQAQ